MLRLCVLLIASCCIQNVCFEMILSFNNRSGSLISFAQFISVVFIELLRRVQDKCWNRTVPMYVYMVIAVLLVGANKANNMALALGISMPLFTLYRSSAVVLSVLMGYVVFEKRYAKLQVVGALVVSMGIYICIVSDDADVKNTEKVECKASGMPCVEGLMLEENSIPLQSKVYGILLILGSLVLSALLGHLQDIVYAKYSVNGVKPHKEFMLYLHVLSLPLMLGMDRKAFVGYFYEWCTSATFLGVPIPLLLVFLSIVANYACIRCIYTLSAKTSTVALNIVLTTRKACTIAISAWMEGTSFNHSQCIGSILVFGGAFAYGIASQSNDKSTKKKEQ